MQNDQPDPAGPKAVHSIRIIDSDAPCAICGCEVAGPGPVGCRDGAPVCDPCLLDASPELGLMLGLVAVTRAYAVASGRAGGECLELLRELGAFARVYELVAARIGPQRPFRLPEAAERVRRDSRAGQDHPGEKRG